LKISTDRVGALIGKNGSTKRAIEEKTKTTLEIDSKEGTVTVRGDDAEGVVAASEVVRAINRGFSPERAYVLLTNPDAMLDVIDLSAIVESPPQLERVRGRVIGRGGRSREQIENMTATTLSVYGKTVAIIGEADQVKTARTAIEMLINGVSHEAVFAFLDRRKREAKKNLLEYYY
jgi:ribosomal RNA assembly protein